MTTKGTFTTGGGYGTLEDGSCCPTEFEVVVEDGKMYAAAPPSGSSVHVTVQQPDLIARGVHEVTLHEDGINAMAEKVTELEAALTQKKYECAGLKNEVRALEKMNTKLLNKLFVVVEAGVEAFLRKKGDETS